jgi:hypothetical protein
MAPCIGIDARKLHDFGIGTYIRNLLKQLARIDQVNEYVLVCQPGDVAIVNELGVNFRAVAETSGRGWTCSTPRTTCCPRSRSAGRS